MDRKIDKRVLKVVYTEDQIVKRIKELGTWVNETFKDAQEELILVGLLKGCLPFLAELMKHITIDHKIDFMIASSYGGTTKSSGNVKIILDLASDISGKNVLIVEDIVDSALTFSRVLELLRLRQPKTLKIVTLVDRPINHKVKVKIDQAGFVVLEKDWLVGFGFDYQEKLRNLPYVGFFNKKYL